MTSALAVMRKELLDLRRNRLVTIVLGLVLAAVVVSVYISSLAFASRMAQYNAYVAALKQAGSTVVPAQPQLFPLQLMRGSIEYIEIIGGLFAVILGYVAIAKERRRGTLELIFTRPIGRWSLAVGKLTALATAWAIALLAIFGAVTLTVLVVGNAPLQSIDYARLGIAALASWAYLVLFSAVALGLSAAMRRPSSALIFGLLIWLVVVLVIPQIGDTMDPDNQVPGGLFRSLQVPKSAELGVLAHFSAFDTARNALEVSSVTKHYERFTFAYLGIKDIFNQQPLATVWHGVWNNGITIWITSMFSLVFATLTTTRKNLLRRSA